MLSTHLRRAIALSAASAALGGCSSKGDASAKTAEVSSAAADSRETPAARQDPCSLITKAEADAILGTAFTVRPGSAAGTCDYVPTEGKRLNGFTITVHWTGGKEALSVVKGGMSIATSMMKTGEMDPSSMMALEPVEGLGDEAYFNPMVGSTVLKDDTLLEFDIRAMMWHQTKEAGKELWKQLASKALARL
jgi:hypothetical protein